MKGRLVPVYTDLIHVDSGLVDRTTIEIPLMKMDPQGMGSAITYGRRYTLLAALGITTDEADDDGESAKPRDLHAKATDSVSLETLKGQIAAHKTLDALTKWGTDPKVRKEIDSLPEAEAERLRVTYMDTREELSK